MIDKNKTYTTRDGCEVRIYAVDGGGSDHIHGAVKSVYGCWIAEQWYSGGKYAYCGVHMKDLIEVRPRIQREVWVNVFRNGVEAYSSRHAADYNVEQIRIACVRLTIDCEEGEGLTDDPR
jgi:hypothetical protein